MLSRKNHQCTLHSTVSKTIKFGNSKKPIYLTVALIKTKSFAFTMMAKNSWHPRIFLQKRKYFSHIIFANTQFLFCTCLLPLCVHNANDKNARCFRLFDYVARHRQRNTKISCDAFVTLRLLIFLHSSGSKVFRHPFSSLSVLHI